MGKLQGQVKGAILISYEVYTTQEGFDMSMVYDDVGRIYSCPR